MSAMTIESYCQPFSGADNSWPDLPLADDAAAHWWTQWMANNAEAEHWTELRKVLPQLWIKPQQDVCKTERYKALVLRGETAEPIDKEQAPRLSDPQGFRFFLKKHPCGTLPVMTFENHDDFVLAKRCLAHRGEPVNVQPSVHAQAIAGLIHWGLIRDVSRQQRCEILMLHRAPYSSLPVSMIPGQDEPELWIDLSQTWRLEHELTHIACKRLVGEMRINLFDELIADAIGMLTALGYFNAEVFRHGLGLNAKGGIMDGARALVYLENLDLAEHRKACQMVLKRAEELEGLLLEGKITSHPIELLRYLTRCRLDQPLTPTI